MPGEGGGAGKARRRSRPELPAVVAALAAAGLSVAAHVMAKAVRDTLYLATFPIEHLPYFFVITAVVSGFAVSAYTRLSSAFSPQRVVPALAVLSALTLPMIWIGVHGVGSVGGPSWAGSRVIIAVLYVWTSIANTLLVSGFWTVFSERFDPRQARRLFGVVGTATTVGGVAGGAGSHALLRVVSPESLLLALAGLEVLAAIAVLRLASGSIERGRATPEPPAAEASESAPPPSAPARGGLRQGVAELLRTPYLRNIALFAAGLTIAGTLCDYVLKDAASRSLSSKRDLAEFFALFHGSVSAVTLAVQVLLCGPIVSRKGLPAALAALPLWLLAGAATLLAAPVLWAAALLRGGENAVRNSFYRAGYELLFVPVSPAQKRVTKPILDALLERLADAAGAGIVLLLVSALGFPAKSLAWVVAAITAIELVIALRVRRGYVDTLSTSLVKHAVEIEEIARAAGGDRATREAVRTTLLDASGDKLRRSMMKSRAGLSLMRSLALDRPEILREAREVPRKSRAAHARTTGGAFKKVIGADPALALVAEMLGPDPAVARGAIASWDGRDRRPVPFMIHLLARDELHREITAALARAGDRIAGALADHLADPDEDFAVRRRLPRVLAACRGEVALAALVQGLVDRRFEVRYQCAAALERAWGSGGGKKPAAEIVWEAIREEVKKSRPMWEAQRLLEEPDATDDDPLMAIAVRRRGAHSLRHVFRLLGLVLDDPEALTVSYQAVHADDPHFRAVGLEYLENVLPTDVRDALWPLIGDDDAPPPSRPARAMAEVMSELLASSGSIKPPAAEAGAAGVDILMTGELAAPVIVGIKGKAGEEPR